MDAFHSDAFDVPDSTDWLGTPLAGLMPVEQAFRCHVCKDFYNSPMITSCNHTFCSLCIRRCLSVDGRCPLCRASDQESKLRGNWALREAVDAFVKSRDALLRFARTPVAGDNTAAAAAAAGSPKRKAAEMDDGSGGDQQQQQHKRLRMATRSSKAKAAEATAAMMREEADMSEPHETADCDEPEPNDGLVACPICWSRMKPWQVDRHIDTSCPGSPQPDNAASTPSADGRGGSNFGGTPRASLQNPPTPTPTKPQKPPERLPTLAYSMLKDTALRKKLAELGLSTAGSRQMLERRHREWVTIWNANCDSARPKKRSELLHDLDVWERTMGSRAPTASRAATMGAMIKDKDFDGAAWAAKHGSSFKELIAKARSSRSKADPKQPAKDSEPGQGSGEASSGQQETGRGPGDSPPQPVPRQSEDVVDLTGDDVVDRAGSKADCAAPPQSPSQRRRGSAQASSPAVPGGVGALSGKGAAYVSQTEPERAALKS